MSDEKNDTEESEAGASKAVPEAANDDDGTPDDGTPEIEVEVEVESEAEAECAAEPAPPTPEEVIADLEDQLLRALAETQNVRRRGEREQSDARRYATADFARDVLTVADNLSRAIETAKAREDEAAGTVIEGVELTLRQLEQMLEKHEIRPIEAMGQKLDPNLHQAMMQIEHPTAEAGTIVQVVQTGYTVHDRLLRPALVGVARPPAAAEGDGEGEGESGEHVDTSA